jgi:uncharacterized NAD(P)/FAD-binding protein YdhS
LTRTLAIVGAGFSGTLLALHALRRAPAGTNVILIERGRRFGHGLAYATGNANHVLNVPAARMSAFHDRPCHFLDWLQAHPTYFASTGQAFVPRQAFGAYIRDLLKAELRRPEVTIRLSLVRGEVQSIGHHGAQLSLRLDRGRDVAADLAVLATRNFLPEPPRGEVPAFPTDAVALLRFLRREAELVVLRGGTWQSVVDSLRPFTHDVWQGMSMSDRARFLRHLRPWCRPSNSNISKRWIAASPLVGPPVPKSGAWCGAALGKWNGAFGVRPRPNELLTVQFALN